MTRKNTEKIYGNVNDLMKIPEIRKILVSDKNQNLEKFWRDKRLSNETKALLKEIETPVKRDSDEIELKLNLDEKFSILNKLNLKAPYSFS